MTWRIEKSTSVYGLISTNSMSEDIKYIGQTCIGVEKRLAKHIENARCGVKTHCYNWIRSQIELGFDITAIVLEENATYGESEKKWISWYKSLGASLTNHTDGGDGAIGWVPSEEQRENMRKSHIGKTYEQTQARMAAQKNNINIMLSDPDRSTKISIALTGKKLSKESIEKRTATRRANGGYKFTDEWKRMQSIRIKKSWDKRKGVINVA